MQECTSDGIPYRGTGAPGLRELGYHRNKRSELMNNAEPVDSSAAAIAAQGFLRLGTYHMPTGGTGSRGIAISNTALR